MKEYCVDLELAVELKKKGFPQETEFYFVCKHLEDKLMASYANSHNKVYSAPIAEEILKELPDIIIDSLWGEFKIAVKKITSEYNVMYYIPGDWDSDMILKEKICNDKKLSNALAKMYLYLKKEGYIK